MNICVFCSSSSAVDEKYKQLTINIARELASRGHNLIYGGASCGLMGIVADVAKEDGAKVTGIIPECIVKLGVQNTSIDTIIECKDLRDRKAKMDELSDAFIILPGGLGTLEEFTEILNLKFLRCHQKPIILINAHNFYDKLLELFDYFIREGFTGNKTKRLFNMTESPKECFDLIENDVKIEIDSSFYERARG